MSKKTKTEQLGVRYPDGRTEWDDGRTFLKLNTEQDRREFLRVRAIRLKEAGVSNDPGVVFLHRYHVVSYTKPEMLEPRSPDFLVFAGNAKEAGEWACAAGLTRNQYTYVSSEDYLRGRSTKGRPRVFFGTFHMRDDATRVLDALHIADMA